MFLIYSVWTTLVLIDKKKGKSSDSNLKESDNGILGGNGVVSDGGHPLIMAGSHEVFGKHRLGQKCYSMGCVTFFFVFCFYCEFHRDPT